MKLGLVSCLCDLSVKPKRCLQAEILREMAHQIILEWAFWHFTVCYTVVKFSFPMSLRERVLFSRIWGGEGTVEESWLSPSAGPSFLLFLCHLLPPRPQNSLSSCTTTLSSAGFSETTFGEIFLLKSGTVSVSHITQKWPSKSREQIDKEITEVWKMAVQNVAVQNDCLHTTRESGVWDCQKGMSSMFK